MKKVKKVKLKKVILDTAMEALDNIWFGNLQINITNNKKESFAPHSRVVL